MKLSLNSHSAFWLMFGLLILWQLPGIIPLASYEADALSVASGCEFTYRSGWNTIGTMGYGFWLQPFTFFLIVALKHLLPSAGCEAIYAGVTAVATIAFQLLSILLASRLMHTDRRWTLLALFLLPESYMLAMYPNSSALPSALFVAALLGVLNSNRNLPGKVWPWLLFGIAPLFRLDVVMAYPAIPLVMRLSGNSWRRSLALSAIFAIVLLAGLWCVWNSLGISLLFVAEEHSRWGDIIQVHNNLLAILGFYGVPILALLVASLRLAFKGKQCKAAWMSLAMILLVHLVQFRFGNASKHFLGAAPFAVALASTSIAAIIANRRRWWSVAAIALIFLSQILGVRFAPGSEKMSQAILNEYVPAPICVDFNLKGMPLQFVVGGGQAAMTADEAILLSGNAFYPFFVHNLKEGNEKYQESLMNVVNQMPQALFVIAPWEESARMQYLHFSGQLDRFATPLPAGNRAPVQWLEDTTLCSLMVNSDTPGLADRMNRYVRGRYSADTTRRVAFIHTESISHRWEMALKKMQQSGVVARFDSVGGAFIVVPDKE